MAATFGSALRPVLLAERTAGQAFGLCLTSPRRVRVEMTQGWEAVRAC